MECGIWTEKTGKKDIHNKEDREKLGLAPVPKGRSAPTTPPNESDSAYQKVDVSALFYVMLCLLSIGFSQVTFSLYYLVVLLKQYEKAKQDDALSDLSDILGDLKGMAIGMGSELDR